MQEEFSLVKSVGLRFLRGGIAGAISAAAAVTWFTGVDTWEQVATALNALAIIGTVGFITGGLMAADKYLRAYDTE